MSAKLMISVQKKLRTIIKSKKALRKSFDASGFNLAWNEGVSAGQTIDHLHIHLLPRKKGDSGVYKYEPREFLYRLGSRVKSTDDELNEVADIVKSKFFLSDGV